MVCVNEVNNEFADIMMSINEIDNEFADIMVGINEIWLLWSQLFLNTQLIVYWKNNENYSLI